MPDQPATSQPASSIKRPASRRGGRRPGAGAPKGNLNALKSGRYSKQMKALRLALQAMPATSDVVRRFDAAGSGKRAILARALQHYAELLVAEPLVLANIVDLLEQTNITLQNDPSQIGRKGRNRENKQSIKHV